MIRHLAPFLCLFIPQLHADWPQWRGPGRDGVVANAKLPENWPEGFIPAKLWESKEIPSDHYGGHGSPVIADGRVFLTLVWHRDVPTNARILTNRIFSDMGARTTNFSPELRAKFEADRLNLSPRLRGKALDDWIKSWMETNMDDKQRLLLDGWIQQRFKLGKTAIPLDDFDRIRPVVDKEFENVEALRAWVAAQAWTDPATAEKVLAAVPNTKVEGSDVAMCLDLTDGKELWRYEGGGHAAGRVASVTPVVAGGKLYTVLSTQVYCLEAASGKVVWSAPVNTKRGIAFSPMLIDDLLVVDAGQLCALDSATGKLVWKNAEFRVGNGSPVPWKDLILCNAENGELMGLEAATGTVRWKQPGGGASTPVVSGDVCLALGKAEGHNLSAFQLSKEGARPLWSKGFVARRYDASPVIHNGMAFHLGSARHLCTDLKTGETKWEVERSSDLSSPLVAGDRLLVYENNGGFLAMIAADPTGHRILGRAKVGGLGCATPALQENLAVIRTRDRIVCYDLTRAAQTNPVP
ncbi:MAG: Outer membrane protein assembly factor BamB, contains PQQ-like beta-propeller repeat [Verrucomicrobia bacterium]|nr:MAG: Outer membrane protein assembly factor BamB, contains PQQ-like beta-propeller repeat [Verrucomicrobiota bacterium]